MASEADSPRTGRTAVAGWMTGLSLGPLKSIRVSHSCSQVRMPVGTIRGDRHRQRFVSAKCADLGVIERNLGIFVHRRVSDWLAPVWVADLWVDVQGLGRRRRS